MRNIFSEFRGRHRDRIEMFREAAMRCATEGRGPFGGRMGGRGGRGGPFGFGGGDDMRGDGGGRGERGERGQRVFGRGDLPMIVLSLVETSPRHGYEIIKAIEERCGGSYAPSPGAIYPTLAMLEDQGHIVVDTSEATTSKRYAITDAGREYLDANRAQVNGILERLDLIGRMHRNHDAPEAIAQAMMTLRHALQLKRDSWSEGDGDRIAAILKRAAFEIIDGGVSTKDKAS